MKFSMEKQGDVVIVAIKDHLVGGADTFEIKDSVIAELGRRERNFLIDMEGAKVVNSSGIGVLVAILTSVKRHEGTLKLCGVSDRARRAFVITGVWSIFEVYETRDEALAAFGG